MPQSRARVALMALAGIALFTFSAPAPPPAKPAPLKAPARPAKVPLYLFTQVGCAPCKSLKLSLASPAVQAELIARFDFSEVSHPDPRFEKFDVSRTPTLVADAPTGVKKRVGSGAPATILAWLQTIPSPAASEIRPPWLRPRSAIVEGGNVGPGGIEIMVDLPPEMWKHNITSRGQGCCVFRSLDHAAHWQNVRELWGFPEWLQSKGLEGGGYPGNVKDRITAICKEHGVPEPPYIQYEGGKDTSILEIALATGRMPCITYDGADGVHYNFRIAHMVNLAYLDGSHAAILDNNFPPDKLLWMSRDDFLNRWSGWAVVLLGPRPPAPPHN